MQMYKYKNISEVEQKFRAGGKRYSVKPGKTVEIPVEITSGVLGVMELVESGEMKKSKKIKESD